MSRAAEQQSEIHFSAAFRAGVGLFQFLATRWSHHRYGSTTELYINVFFSAPKQKPPQDLFIRVREKKKKADGDFSQRERCWNRKQPSGAVGWADGIHRPLDSLAQEYYYWFRSWATAYWMHRLVFFLFFFLSTAKQRQRELSLSANDIILQGCLPSRRRTGRRKYIYLSLCAAGLRGRGDYLSRLSPVINVCLGCTR